MVHKISTSIPRFDAGDKISGKAKYIADLDFDEVLYARTIRSEKAHAEIRAVHLPEIPDGYFVIDKNDSSGKNHMQSVVSDHPLFAEEEALYIGQPILLLIGPSKEKTVELADQVRIEYRELPAVTGMEEALGKKDFHVEYAYSKGDPGQAFEEAEKIITGEYDTGQPEHLYLETNGVVAVTGENRITIYGSFQCPYFVKNAVVEATGFKPDQIRVIQTVTGGAFGGKEEYPSLLASQAAIASYKTGRPVSLILDRKEDLEATTKRHPSRLIYKAALNKQNEITGLDIDITFDGGAYATISPVVLQRGMFTATGVYQFPNIRVAGRVVKTNKVPSGAFRGFGAPQVIFGLEQFMHRLAGEIGISSLDFKRKHLLQKGATTSTGGKIWDEVKLPEMIDELISRSGYAEKKKNQGKNQGVGLSLFLHGCGFTGRGEEIISGKVNLKKKGNRVSILTSNVEMGQGASTTLVKIVSHCLSIPEKQIVFERQDTDGVPDSGPTVASRTAMIIGGLVRKASLKLLEQWDKEDAEVLEVYKHPAYVSWDNDTFKGDAYPVYSWGVNVVEVEAEPVSCELNVKKIWGVFDIGVALDENIIRGQMQGGMLQGLGFAYLEKMTGINGKLAQLNLTDYTIPTPVDTPEMEIDFVENPYEFGPFGAKCAGELPLSGIAPALAEAAEQALSVNVTKAPMTPEYLKGLKHDD